MKKILFTAKVDQHIINFHLPYLKYFKEKGYEVHVASHGNQEIPFVDKKHELPLIQSPTNVRKVTRAFKTLKRITKENNYTIVHCHTPVIGVLTRLITIPRRKEGTKVIYTAHGFHFYKDAPLSHWLLYFPAEKFLSRFTDVLITINEEDYENTIRYNFKAKETNLVPGVGIDLQKFSPNKFEEKNVIRNRNNLRENEFILSYVAELNTNKNQALLINMIDKVKETIPEIKLLLIGEGEQEAEYKQLVKKKGLEENIQFLGFRADVGELLKLANLSVSSSNREGLPLNVLEGMAMEKPLIVTNVRGNRDLVTHKENGFVVNNLEEFASAVVNLYHSKETREQYGNASRLKAEKYALDAILLKMEQIYEQALKKEEVKMLEKLASRE